VELGFDDFRHAQDDPDLGWLATSDDFERRRGSWEAELRSRQRQRALALGEGRWSPWQDLPDRRGGLTPPDARVRLRAGVAGLECEMSLSEADLPQTPPWRPGGGGVLACVLLGDEGLGEGREHLDLGFGWQDGLPTGAVRLGDRWQPLAELSPKADLDHATDRLNLRFRIPWSLCGTLHPLLDDELALNLALLTPAGGEAALLRDPGLGRADRAWRRGVPLTVAWEGTEPAIGGRLADRVVRGGRAEVELRALLPDPRLAAEVRLILRDERGTIVHEAVVPLPGAGRDRRARAQLDLPARAAQLRLGASLRSDDPGLNASWEAVLAALPPGYLASTPGRIDAAPAGERATLEHRWSAIGRALAARHPRQTADALATTVAELEALLQRLEATGTILPAGGDILAAMPGAAGEVEGLCSLSLPPQWRRGQPLRTVVLLVRAPGAEHRAVRLAPRLLADRFDDGSAPPLVFAVPHAPTRDPADTLALLRWLRDFLGSDRVHLAGVDLLGATALEVAARAPTELAGVLLLTGLNFRPYPDLDEAAIAARLAEIPAELPLGWYWFPDEQRAGDQARTLRRLLREQGRGLAPRQPVAGGLSFDQAWSRALLWGAGVPSAPTRGRRPGGAPHPVAGSAMIMA
jgi:hypothetical protein